MKGDFSKDTFHPEKHFHDVLMQQGRVLLDAEWNEQSAIISHRTETGTKDIIGDAGAPLHDDGFEIIPVPAGSPPATGLKISKGRFYVEGILVENNDDVLFTEQEDFPGQVLPATKGSYLAYLDIWQRHITIFEDPAIREVALGGPDTTTRAKTIWQVRLKGVTPDVTCASAPIDIDTPGQLKARSEKSEDSTNPCELEKSGGYRRLENQLYRVEIFGGGNRASATFTWSRDNGTVLAKWESQDTNKLTVSNPGRDELLSFRGEDWIELTNDKIDLLGKRGILVKISKVEDRVLIIDTTTAIIPPDLAEINITSIDKDSFGDTARVRRWDMTDEGAIKLDEKLWIPLEDGVEVNFGIGSYKAGDYWLIPGRTPIANVEWPVDAGNNPISQPPRGIKHYFANLAILDFDGTNWVVTSDCRPIFPPLTELSSLYYVSGDGQEAMPGIQLREPLMVGVTNGQHPVANARIRFELFPETGQPVVGSLEYTDVNGVVHSGLPVVNTFTNAEGIAQCKWTLGINGTALSQQVKATFRDAADNPVSLPVIFTANLSVASQVLYDGTGCDNWGTEPHNTVAEAITALCMRTSGNKRSCSVTVGQGGTFETLAQAFKALAGTTDDVCICLLSPVSEKEHIAKNLQVEVKNTIKITGCGATIRISGELFSLRAEKIILHGITLVAEDKTVQTQLRFAAREINVDFCTFGQVAEVRGIDPFIVITPGKEQPGAMLNWVSNKVFIKTSMAIGTKVLGTIENNIITGTLVLYYDGNIAWKETSDAQALQEKMKESSLLFFGQVYIRGNTVDNILCNSSGIIKPNLSYQSLIVSDNAFQKTDPGSLPTSINSLVAEFVNVANNHFVDRRQRNRIQVVGRFCTAIGNNAPNDNNVMQLFQSNGRIGVPPPSLNILVVVEG